ncbi:MAG: hypothetical protein ACM3TN_18790 [Alphaproteobacteria bacterium]
MAEQAQTIAELRQELEARNRDLAESLQREKATAIENARLFQELKESLEQQTATCTILGVIASSPTDIQPVLNAVAESAARLCEGLDASIYRIDGDPTGTSNIISAVNITSKRVVLQIAKLPKRF